ncbi:MAG: cytochrome c3 family protein [Bacteroidota bacterium]
MSYLGFRKTGKPLFFIASLALSLLFSFTGAAFANPIGTDHAPVHKADKEMTHEILMGERLFYGLTPYESGTFNCAGCHYTAITDTINWSPSATDLALWFKRKRNSEVKTVFETPVSQKMTDAHKGIKVTDGEINNLRAYFNNLEMHGLAPLKAFPIKLILFFLVGILMALALVDLIFTRRFKYRAIHYIVLIAGLGFHSQLAYTEAKALSRTPGYAPDQPIKFSHKVHAGDNKIDCQYCHSGASTGKSAVIPSANLCLNCHNAVLNGRNSGKFEIQKIKDAIANNTPIEWVRIHKLQDHVFFSHAQHVGAGKIACATCHGAVETMNIMKQENDLSMGWCVNCHRQTKVQMDNPYYKNATKLNDLVKSGQVKAVTAETIGGLDCMKCHY